MTRSRASAEPSISVYLPQTPAEYLDLFRLRWYWIPIGIVLGIIGSQIAIRFVPQRFVSETVVLVESDTIPQRLIPKITTDAARGRLTTVHEEILARANIERILEDLNPYPELADTPRAQLVDMVRGRTMIALRSKEAFVLQYTDSKPERAQQMAARLASLFIEQTTGDRASRTLDANRFIEEQLQETRTDLESVEARLGAVKTQNMGMLPRQLEANLATLQRFEVERQSLASEIRSAKERQSLLQRQLSLQSQMSEPEAQLLPTVEPSTEPTQPSTLGEHKKYLAQLRTRYTDEHPEVRATLARIARLEKQQSTDDEPVEAIATATAPGVDPLDSGEAPTSGNEPGTAPEAAAPAMASGTENILLADLRAQVAVLANGIQEMEDRHARVQRDIAEYQARVERIPAVEQELQALERDYSLMSKYYSELLNRQLEAQTAGAVQRQWREQFSIVDPAQVPQRPDYPKPSLFFMLGTLVGLGAGVACAFLLEVLDPTVKNLRELEALVPYPVLLALPQIKHNQSSRESNREPKPPQSPSKGSKREENLSAAS